MKKAVGTVTAGGTIDVGSPPGGVANGGNKVNLNDFYIFVSNYGKGGAVAP